MPKGVEQSDRRGQAVTGVVPPQLAEALIREAWPSVAALPLVARVIELLTRTIILAPLGWPLALMCYFGKLLPFRAKRYTLTNRRLMIQRGLRPSPIQALDLGEIEDVRLAPGSYSAFYKAGNLEVISKGQVAMKLAGVPEPESFRHTILDACRAWAPKPKKT